MARAASALALLVAVDATVGRCRLGKGGPEISCIAAGTLHLHEAGNATQVLAKIQAALDVGITTWDLSDVYNSMPALFGAALQLQPSLRPQLEIIAKMDIVGTLTGSFGFDTGSSYDSSAAHLNAVLNTYLTALNTTYVDAVLLHRQDYLLNMTDLASTVQAWMAAGSMRSFGVSNFDRNAFEALNAHVPLVANEVEISVLNPRAVYDGTVAYHYGDGSTLLAWSPVGGDPWGNSNRLFRVGSLDGTQRNARVRAGLATVATALGVTPDVVAVAWLMRHPAGIVPIIGTMDPVHLAAQANASSVAAAMTRQQWYYVADAAGLPIY